MGSSENTGIQRGVTYSYESLLDEHFQHLVQALLVKEYPGLQCLPVGMPDGGRDAYTQVNGDQGGIVVQVKFSRNPSKIESPFDWFVDAVEGELGKVEKLIRRGMRRYIFVSNVPGSSHLDGGVIDKANRYLSEHLAVPSQCFWRDDLDRRLDDAYDIKLRFPHLLNGPDLLRLIWESSNNESLTRRRATIEAYLRAQYVTDESLRFKQVEMLTTKLFDLYIDVPIRPLAGSPRATIDKGQNDVRQLSIAESIAIRVGSRDLDAPRQFPDMHDPSRFSWPGAADLLCDPIQLSSTRRIVIEGAPGQGKTTLTQYLAQIQRARYLKKTDELDALPAGHKNGPILLPLKIELRDLSRWLNGRDPWHSDSSATHNEIPSLESALAGHIRRYSGGSRFDVDDLRALLTQTPSIIMLDALDEVADLSDRKRVVAEIESASERLEGTDGKVIILVTSRPTAISSAPKIDRAKFVHYSLQPIRTGLALEYAKQWSTARGILSRDAEELQRILREKLESTHMAELAKNTMQLTILLSLVLARGSSLPDKRTELYTSYLDLFLSRESDKSADVRDNRPLILELHGYLAYQLHARAEERRATGRISSEELRLQVSSYLQREGHDPALTQRLFDALVQRVVAIVSRIEGTFEFEVQPLREYFAARHLYMTAPYSPTGREQKGTKPDRFDGIAPNPYWMNVTRFYAGFFSKGEIMDLAHRVCALITSSDPSMDFYPRRLALALLQDWVFSQVPPTVKMVVETLLEETGLVWAGFLRSDHRMGRYLTNEAEDFILWPNGGGAEYARDIIWARIVTDTADEWCRTWCSLLSALDTAESIHRRWSQHFRTLKSIKAKTRWSQVAEYLHVTSLLTAVEYSEVLQISTPRQLATRAVALRSNEGQFQRLPEEDQHSFVSSVLSLGSARSVEFIRRPEVALSDLLLLAHPHVWTLRGVRAHWYADTRIASPDHGTFADVTLHMVEAYQGDIYGSLEPWIQVVGLLEDHFWENSLHNRTELRSSFHSINR